MNFKRGDIVRCVRFDLAYGHGDEIKLKRRVSYEVTLVDRYNGKLIIQVNGKAYWYCASGFAHCDVAKIAGYA